MAITLTVHESVVYRYGIDRVFRLTLFAKPQEVSRAHIEIKPAVKRDQRWRGRAYFEERRIVIHVPTMSRRRYRAPAAFAGTPGSRGYQGVRVYSDAEAFLFVLAHELRHLWQKVIPRGARVWGARGRYSERDADCYGLSVIRRYRRGEGRIVPRGTFAGTYRATLEYVAPPANKS